MNSIRELRKRLGMTQTAFAEFCDVFIVSIARYETGQNISRSSAEKIARACQVSVDYVLYGDTEMDLQMSEVDRNPLIPEEKDLVHGYRMLNNYGKTRMRETLNEMLQLYREASKQQP